MKRLPYSTTKLVHHPDLLQALKRRQHVAPIQIHFMPALACNHSCSFCLVAGTQVLTTKGETDIATIVTGARVVVGDLERSVTNTGSRWADNLYEVTFDDGTQLKITGEHPILLRQGFVEAHAAAAGDWAASDVSVRLREPREAVHPRKKVEVAESAAGACLPGSESNTTRARRVVEAYARKQPNEAPRDSQGQRPSPEGSPYQPQRARIEEHSGSGTQAYAERPESYEGPEGRTEGAHAELGQNQKDWQGNRVRELVSAVAPELRTAVHWQRHTLDSSQESRLHSAGCRCARSVHARVLQQGRSGVEDAGKLRTVTDQSVRVGEYELPSSLHAEALAEVRPDWAVRGSEVVFGERRVGGLSWKRITDVRRLRGTYKVYNLSVAESEAYVANGTVTHNCSYGHRKDTDPEVQFGWKNMELMSDAHMPREIMLECLDSWKRLNVQAIEITGGGEPLIWPFIDEFLVRAGSWGVDLGLVTNGTAMTEDRSKLFGATNWKWARVSIDAGTRKNYVRVRRVNRNHWNLAWNAVSLLAQQRSEPDHRVGAGFVVDSGNFLEVKEFVRLAKEAGADNVRLSLAFTPQGTDRFPSGALIEATHQAEDAKSEYEDERFQVNNLVGERVLNVLSGAQTYKFCAVKQLLCVVGGDGNVYNCCTLAFNKKGMVGSLHKQSFYDLWTSEETALKFLEHDAREVCDMECLYEKRNKDALRLMRLDKDTLAGLAANDQAIHRNFI